MIDTWHFLEHPAFRVFDAAVRERLASFEHFPAPSELAGLSQGIARAEMPWFEFARQMQRSLHDLGGFDRVIAETGRIPTREGSFHDLLGALIWLHFPALKTAIHRAQLACAHHTRSASENAATHFDESGVLVLSCEPAVFERLAGLRWRDVFWEGRSELGGTTRFIAFGHGLLDSLREAHPRLMGKALFARVDAACLDLGAPELRVFVDRALASQLPQFLSEPARLQPLPVLGIPGWAPHPGPDFYDDTTYFRTARQRVRSNVEATWLDLCGQPVIF